VAGQQDDARMCLALALTAAKLGAATANYTEVTGLVKTADGHVAGAKVQDRLTGIIVSQCVLNTISLICHFHLFFILACMTAGFVYVHVIDRRTSTLSVVTPSSLTAPDL